MAAFTGDVEYSSGGPTKFKVVFRMVDEIISQQPVETQKDGEELIISTLQELHAVAKREGYV